MGFLSLTPGILHKPQEEKDIFPSGRKRTTGKGWSRRASDAVEGFLPLGSLDPQILLINLELFHTFKWIVKK